MEDDFLKKSFSITPQHYTYLEKIGQNNVSHALRQILNEHQTQHTKLDYNQTFTYLSYSILLFFIAYLLEPPIQQISIILSIIFTIITLNTAQKQLRRKK